MPRNIIACAALLALLVSASCTAQNSLSTEGSQTHASQKLLERTGGFDLGYIFSYMFDDCGDYTTGKIFREAIIAKVESCPFTSEAKQKFFKEAALMSNERDAVVTGFWINRTQYVSRKDAHCDEKPRKPREMALRQNILLYQAGKIKLIDILSDQDCREASKDGFEPVRGDYTRFRALPLEVGK